MSGFQLELLRRKHPTIVDVIPIDSRTGRGIASLRDKLSKLLF